MRFLTGSLLQCNSKLDEHKSVTQNIFNLCGRGCKVRTCCMGFYIYKVYVFSSLSSTPSKKELDQLINVLMQRFARQVVESRPSATLNLFLHKPAAMFKVHLSVLNVPNASVNTRK